MPPVTELLLLAFVLSFLYAGLGLLSLGLERGPALLLRRPRRVRPQTSQRVRRRVLRPRRRPGAVAAPRVRSGGRAATA
ncbi:MAG: hypothetical protein LJE69_03365 [Thiohalocapsa sp.]|jgi:hypothetical protein|uniref:hypothetical protein n=1 Tax=Thiohalocapsa sp. TaxID=2497641 RepID=UPI0025CC788C|nr:hypothetical protein [Thiohalocapsa sp.]MCG6940273.1 hypothetical protein [Thiohalocapsa sp.]